MLLPGIGSPPILHCFNSGLKNLQRKAKLCSLSPQFSLVLHPIDGITLTWDEQIKIQVEEEEKREMGP